MTTIKLQTAPVLQWSGGLLVMNGRFILNLHVVKIFVQNVRTKEFFTGQRQWSANPDKAFTFANGHSAMEFCHLAEKASPGILLMLRFETPEKIGDLAFNAAQ